MKLIIKLSFIGCMAASLLVSAEQTAKTAKPKGKYLVTKNGKPVMTKDKKPIGLTKR